MKSLFTVKLIFFLFILTSPAIAQQEIEASAQQNSLRINKNGIKVYIYDHRDFEFATFRAVTHLKATPDSILALMFDNQTFPEWVYACHDSFLIKHISFYERYHYQAIDIPFPFKDRDFIFHSVLKHNPETGVISINMRSDSDYCEANTSAICDRINQSHLVRVKTAYGRYLLEPDKKGTRFTWIQHTNPAGKLPGWLVNQFMHDTPYWTLKKMAEKVQEDKYKYARLIYDKQGIAISLELKAPKTAKDFRLYPTF